MGGPWDVAEAAPRNQQIVVDRGSLATGVTLGDGRRPRRQA
jgi:hypothetical protein